MDNSIVQAMEESCCRNLVPEFRATSPIGVPVPLPPYVEGFLRNANRNDPKEILYTRSKGHPHGLCLFTTAMAGHAEQRKWG